MKQLAVNLPVLYISSIGVAVNLVHWMTYRFYLLYFDLRAIYEAAK